MQSNKNTINDILNTIIQGDTLTELRKIPDNSVDLGITSPPYNKGEKNKGWLVKNVEYDIARDNKKEIDYQNEQILVLNELYRVIKSGGSFFYNHKLRWEKGKLLHPMEWLLKTNWNIKQEIIWDRSIAANIRGWRFWQVEERIYWLYKPKNNNLIGDELKSKHALMTSIWRFLPEQKVKHPAPFPLQLPLRCIYSILDNTENQVVIDPYAGSGTTLIASKLLKHNYIGIEISTDYINLANERLNTYKNNKDIANIFDEEIKKHIVKETFKQRKERGLYSNHTNKNNNSNLSLELNNYEIEKE